MCYNDEMEERKQYLGSGCTNMPGSHISVKDVSKHSYYSCVFEGKTRDSVCLAH